MANHSEIIKSMEHLSPWRFVLLWIWLMWIPTAAAGAIWLAMIKIYG